MAEENAPTPVESTQTIRTQEEWLEREKDLMNQIAILELEREHAANDSRLKIKRLEVALSDAQKGQEKLAELEKEINALRSRSDSEDIKRLKQKHEDLLTKAKELLFEKTKTNKQQELQIEAYKNQIVQLKEVVAITKDMLEIRNSEAKHLNARFETIELRLKAEKDRQGLMEKKLDISKQMYVDLKQEYDIQSGLFKELQGGYAEKINLLETEIEKAKPKPE